MRFTRDSSPQAGLESGLVPLAQETDNGIYPVLTDQIGFPRALFDQGGKRVWNQGHTLWGQPVPATSVANHETSIDATSRFPGQWEDEESGLHYNLHRYYEPQTGQYLSNDPIGLEGGLRTHAYVHNPVQWSDRTGLAGCSWNSAAERWRDSDSGQFRKRPTELVATEPGTAFFWSGRTNGVGGMDVAADIAGARGGTTLEMLLKEQSVTMPTWDSNNPTVVNEWGQMSKAYAEQASGNVRGVIGQDLRPGNVWEGYEKDALISNPDVTSIEKIDPESQSVSEIFRR